MDIRGVEITNQLRSAIRAKLIELGVRYDEELPDYILVMVVNKKSRQQMNEDLNLFLEDSTEPFVNWLHDQVLKKLQKVTIAKKKSNKETVPNAVVKKEEDQEKKKPKEEVDDSKPKKSSESELTKHDRDREFDELVGDLAMLNEEDSKEGLQELENIENNPRKRKISEHTPNSESNADEFEKRAILSSSVTVPKPNSSEKVTSSETSPSEVTEKKNDSSKQNLEQASNSSDDIIEEKQAKYLKLSDDSDNDDDSITSLEDKPKVLSVVSVKSRLGVISPTRKGELKSRVNSDVRDSSNKSHLDDRRNDSSSQKSSFNQSKIVDKKKQRNEDQRNKIQSSNNSKSDKLKRIENLRDKERLSNKSGTIKSRLGIISNTHKEEKLPIKSSNSTTKVSKPRVSNVKSRLGVRTKQSKGLTSVLSRLSQAPAKNFEEDEDDTESVINTSLKSHIIAVNPPVAKKLKTRNLTKHVEKKDVEQEVIEEVTIDDEEEEDLCKVPSKIIVTPRPLKPLKPTQKRATQSLLLRAVAEANQSVVMQKKVDPCLKVKEQKKSVNNLKIIRDPLEGKVVSVSLNSKKRLVMDKIKVELANSKKKKSSKTRSSNTVTDEDLNVVKSLFKRSDDKQKFLVTLNGYNNNVLKDQPFKNDEPIEVEINDDDETINKIEDDYTQYESYNENDQTLEDYQDDQDIIIEEDVYDHQDNAYVSQDNIYVNPDNVYVSQDNVYVSQDNVYVGQDNVYVGQDNVYVGQDNIYVSQDNVYVDQKVEQTENNTANSKLPENSSNNKKRKLSPIVYTRSPCDSPVHKPSLASTVTSVLRIDKRPLISSVIKTVADKSNEKCRYWPSCTLGIKCAYYHPEVLCSSFPACKFGDKCAYKHPKCKFASSCTKIGCKFSHPPVKCKYHPYCMKPGCPFSHPKTSLTNAINAPLTPDISSVRAKFTWKKKE